MSANWDFRDILNLHPDSDGFECVGINTSDDSTCFNKRPLLSDLDLSKASNVLDLMDHCESLKTSFGYLDELAKLCLCVVHSDAGTAHIVSHWKNRVVHHMKKEVSSSARPKTRRPMWKERGNSQSLMAVLDEVKDKGQAPPTPGEDSIAETTKRPTPARNMSTKISSLISEVGFQDPSNENYSTIEKPAKIIPRPASRIQASGTGNEKSSREDAWAAEQLSSLLSGPQLINQVTHKDIEDGLAAFVNGQIGSTRPRGMTSDTMKAAPPTPKFFHRPRTSTMSSNGSSTTSRSKHSSAQSAAESTPPSSVEPSPAMKPTTKADNLETLNNIVFKPLSLPASVLKRASTVSGSPEPLPKFDFGIFSNLPLPPGHKRSIAERNKRMSITSEDTSVFELDPGYKPHAKPSELDPSWSAFPALAKGKQTEVFSSSNHSKSRPESAKPLLPRRASDRLRVTTNLVAEPKPVLEKPATLRPKTPMYDIVSPIEESREETSWLKTGVTPRQSQIEISPLPTTKDTALLPECDSIGPIRTSWIVSPISQAPSRAPSRRMSRSHSFSLSRSGSIRSSRSPSPAPSRSESPAPGSLTRTLSRSLSRSNSNSTRTPAIARAPSLLSRTLSRTLSRSRSSSKSRPSTANEPAMPQRRAMDLPSNPHHSAPPSTDTVPLTRLIQMSHELALRLDGHESYGEVTVRPSSSYKYKLPSARNLAAPPVPELRMSRLFIGLDLDITSHQKFSQLDFQIPRKAVAQEVTEEREQREQYNQRELRQQRVQHAQPQQQHVEKQVYEQDQEYHEIESQPRGRAPVIMERIPARSRSLGSRTEIRAVQSDKEAWPLVEDDIYVCGVCGGQHGKIWKCGKMIERAVLDRGTQKKRKEVKEPLKKNVKKANVGARARRGTIKRIRMRVVRALTV